MNIFTKEKFFILMALAVCFAIAAPNPPNPGVLADFDYTIRGILLRAGWRDEAALDTMSPDDKRNTLIVELSNVLDDGVPFYQSQNDDQLVDIAANYLLVLWMGWVDFANLKDVSKEYVRNSLIVNLNDKLDISIHDLQSTGTRDLVKEGLAWYNKEVTVSSLYDCQYDLTKAVAISETPEILTKQKYSNTSPSPLQNTFTVDKSVQVSSSFTQSQDNSLQFSDSVTVSGGLPEVGDASTTLSFQISQSQTVSYTNTTILTREFSDSAPVTIPAGQCILMTAVVTSGTYSVPYGCKANTQTGSVYQVSGNYLFGEAYGLQVEQDTC